VIGRPESANLIAIKTGTQVKAVKYMCGCVQERSEPVAMAIFNPRCPQHGQRITGFWRK